MILCSFQPIFNKFGCFIPLTYPHHCKGTEGTVFRKSLKCRQPHSSKWAIVPLTSFFLKFRSFFLIFPQTLLILVTLDGPCKYWKSSSNFRYNIFEDRGWYIIFFFLVSCITFYWNSIWFLWYLYWLICCLQNKLSSLSLWEIGKSGFSNILQISFDKSYFVSVNSNVKDKYLFFFPVSLLTTITRQLVLWNLWFII